jgi:hypothetical protein
LLMMNLSVQKQKKKSASETRLHPHPTSTPLPRRAAVKLIFPATTMTSAVSSTSFGTTKFAPRTRVVCPSRNTHNG